MLIQIKNLFSLCFSAVYGFIIDANVRKTRVRSHPAPSASLFDDFGCGGDGDDVKITRRQPWPQETQNLRFIVNYGDARSFHGNTIFDSNPGNFVGFRALTVRRTHVAALRIRVLSSFGRK